MIANLQMYDWPELRECYRIYWDRIRAELRNAGLSAPDELSHVRDESSVWLRPDLVLSQACGLPYRLSLHGRVCLIGTPDYGVDGCPPGHYRSVLVVRHDESRRDLADFRDCTFAYNNRNSQSGYGAPFFHVSEQGFWFTELVKSGGHKESVRMVAEGKADLTSIDAVSWRFMQRYDGYAKGLRVLASTAPTPGLPYISAAGNDRHALFDCIDNAIRELPDDVRSELGIVTLVDLPADDYLALPVPE